jgi:hypothetical protein
VGGPHRFGGAHEHALRPTRDIAPGQLGKLAQRSLGRKREADLGRAQIASPELVGSGRIETRRRLVEEDQVGVADQGQGQVEPPALATRQVLGPLVALSVSSTSSTSSSTDRRRGWYRPYISISSATVRSLYTPHCWSTIPTRSRSSREPLAGSIPSTLTSPPVRVR